MSNLATAASWSVETIDGASSAVYSDEECGQVDPGTLVTCSGSNCCYNGQAGSFAAL